MNRIQNQSSKEVTAEGSKCGQPGALPEGGGKTKSERGRWVLGPWRVANVPASPQVGEYLKETESHPLLHTRPLMQRHHPPSVPKSCSQVGEESGMPSPGDSP